MRRARTDVDVSKHGIEVLKALRKEYEIKRAAANRVVKDRKTDAEVAAQKALDAMMKPGADSKTPIAEARATAEEASKTHARLLGTMEAEKRALQSGEATRRKIADARAKCVLFSSSTTASQMAKAVAENVEKLKTALRDAQAELEVIQQEANALRQIEALEETIAGAAAQTVTDEDIARSSASVAVAAGALVGAQAAEEAARAEAVKAAAEIKVDEAARLADTLDLVLTVLREKAPSELAARGNAIPGFDFEAMTLDGVPVATLNSAKQLEFAVSLAKRMSTGVKTLVVDGLERLDSEQLPRFLKMATSDGWQLLGTQVSDGEELVFHAMDDVLAGDVIR